MAYETVGWTRSMWFVRSVGSEYAMVTMLSWPVSSCLKTWKSASKSSLALLTVVWKPSQSPVGDSFFAVMPFSCRNALTALTVSWLGATNSSTFVHDMNHGPSLEGVQRRTSSLVRCWP